MEFTYLDLIDPTISFVPIMATNWFKYKENHFYSIFTDNENKKFQIPGYHGNRCIIEFEMAKRLATIQKKLTPQGLSLRIYDAYRPQQAVNFFTEWTQLPDTPLAKELHYPRAEKKDFHALSYLSQTSSHTLGTAVDVTLIHLDKCVHLKDKNKNFLGLWDPEALDVGNVGYLAFDERSGHSFDELTKEQKENRKLLYDVMIDHEFKPLAEEFWHYYFAPHRNKDMFFDFDVRDNYLTIANLTLDLDS
ncbi:MAG: D-alanyl-D-alanine carboxypeptidase family protein [Alphaproteobacteria bacterium]|nr:D-alanyl-D-alanine carboxypeptidase family protein [Alphaproteobacteria bacterium]